MHIVRVYEDPGRSGLTLQQRFGLQALLADVQSGQADFSVVLVFDISRWGRFQVIDEGAYYDFLCRTHDVRVIYCAETFPDDDSLVTSIFKHLRRMMAAEYSRDLSYKVFLGKCRLIELGYWQGAPCGFGFRRKLVDEHGRFKAILAPGEYKNLKLDRVVLAPGPDEEIRQIRKAFELYVHNKLSMRVVADCLNAGDKAAGDPWTYFRVRDVLGNEKYIGNNVYCRKTARLGTRERRLPQRDWIRKPGAFPAIVDLGLFQQAQAERARRSKRWTDEQMLQALKDLLDREGYLTIPLVNAQPSMLSSFAYKSRFGTMREAYTRVGYTPLYQLRRTGLPSDLDRIRSVVIDELTIGFQSVHASISSDGEATLDINNEWSIGVVVLYCRKHPACCRNWSLHTAYWPKADILLLVRLERGCEQIKDYFAIPALDIDVLPRRLSDHNDWLYESYRIEHFDSLYVMAERNTIGATL